MSISTIEVPQAEIVGRRASHFTRLPLLLAHSLGVPCRLTPIPDMRKLDTGSYAGNPALKLPILRTGEHTVFGALNICRALAAHPSAHSALLVVWPEDQRDTLSRNAHELLWHSMAAQVQLVMGITICKLPADNPFFVKARASLEGSLAWLDSHLRNILQLLPATRDISLFEAALFCLVEHFQVRSTVSIATFDVLKEFAATFGQREAARATAYP